MLDRATSSVTVRFNKVLNSLWESFCRLCWQHRQVKGIPCCKRSWVSRVGSAGWPQKRPIGAYWKLAGRWDGVISLSTLLISFKTLLDKVFVGTVFMLKHYSRRDSWASVERQRHSFGHGKEGQGARSQDPQCSAFGLYLRRSWLSPGRRGELQSRISEPCRQSAAGAWQCPCLVCQWQNSHFLPVQSNSVLLSDGGNAISTHLETDGLWFLNSFTLSANEDRVDFTIQIPLPLISYLHPSGIYPLLSEMVLWIMISG